MKRETLFKLIALALPILLLILLEITLRVIGYGERFSLFNKVKIENEPEYLEMNPRVARKYFPQEGFNSDNQFDLFLRTKTDSTFRIFVQGASTAVGFPYYRAGSFPRMLKHRLSQTFPEKNIEVINTGITAVNSYTLWDLTDEIIAQQPDLVIIYAGHNEYYGALGVGAFSSLGNYPALIRCYLFLKNFRFFQLLENSYYKFGRFTASEGPSVRETTLMEVMVKEQHIHHGSELFKAGIKQFESNLNQILKKYDTYRIPVILSILVSNEKDVKPFISDSIENEKVFIEAINQLDTKAHELAQNNALAAYRLGRHYLDINKDSAQKYLHHAKELDMLRFRAPKEINDIIADLAQKYQIPLVDMKEVFLAHSPKGVIGNELMTEHVHPNIKGYFLMADAFYQKIKETNLLDDWQNYISYDEAFQDIPVTQIDSIKGKFVIDDLKKSWPYDLDMAGTRPQKKYFIPNATYDEKRALDLYTNMANWKEVMVYSLAQYELAGAYEKALRVAQSLILEYPEEAKLYRSAGEISLKLGKPEKADYYFLKYNQLK